MALVAGKPAPLLRLRDGSDGLHLLAIPLKAELASAYAPSRLTAKDYPGLVAADAPVDTVAVGVVLIAANLTPNSERARNLANFVDAFFTQFPTLLEPGHEAKWREVNLAAELPGWQRFPAADQWLARNAPVAKQVEAARDEDRVRALPRRAAEAQRRGDVAAAEGRALRPVRALAEQAARRAEPRRFKISHSRRGAAGA